MKALNHKEITKKYLLFLLNFTVLLAVTVFCYYLYLRTNQQQARMIVEKQKEHEYIFIKRQELERKLDTLTQYMNTLGTGQVENEEEQERRISRIKNAANQELGRLKENGDPMPYLLFDKALTSASYTSNSKHILLEAKTKEDEKRKELEDCIEADKKFQRKLISN